jgi:DNA-binding PadR family transcriptional regulator
MRTLSESRADLWVELSEKHVYYILRKLERDGLVVAEPQLESGRPARRVFSITPAGREAFARMMTAESLIESVPYSEFDVVFGMLAYTDALLDAEKSAVLKSRRAFLGKLVTQAQDAGAAAARGDLDGLPRLVLDKLARVTIAELAWLDEVLNEIDRAGWSAMRPSFVDPARIHDLNEGDTP